MPGFRFRRLQLNVMIDLYATAGKQDNQNSSKQDLRVKNPPLISEVEEIQNAHVLKPEITSA